MTITLTLDERGRTDRRQVLAAFADGVEVETVYGRDREAVAQSLASHLRGIIPDRSDLLHAAFGYGGERRIRAYRNGRAYLAAAYWGYPGIHGLPEV